MTVLITGAASGIGAASADLLIFRGHSVIALDVAAIPARDGLTPFTVDVTDTAALSSVADSLAASGVRLDAILSCAGIHRMTSLVEGEPTEMRRLIEVNLIGAMNVNRIFFPLLSERGRIVIVTSEVAPLDPLAFNGLYGISKTALDTYAASLRMELGLIGIPVVTIRPGAVETPLCSSSLAATERLASETVLYKKQAAHFLGIVKRFMGKPMPPAKFAPVILRALTARRPRACYSKNRNPGLILLSALPQTLQCRIIKMLLNRKPHKTQTK